MRKRLGDVMPGDVVVKTSAANVHVTPHRNVNAASSAVMPMSVALSLSSNLQQQRRIQAELSNFSLTSFHIFPCIIIPLSFSFSLSQLFFILIGTEFSSEY